MADFIDPAKVNIFWKDRFESLDALKLGTVLQSPQEDQDSGVAGIQNVGFLPPLSINDSIKVDLFYQGESKAGKKRKIEWLETKLLRNINQAGGIAAGDTSINVDNSADFVIGDFWKLEQEIVEITNNVNPITVVRGQHGTEAVPHPNGTDMVKLECSVPTNSLILDGKTDPLPIPTGVVATGSQGIITVRWLPYGLINQKLLKHFLVWRGLNNDPALATLRDRTDSTDYIDHIGEGDTTRYWYFISAMDTSGNETGKSVPAGATAIIDDSPPTVPGDIGTELAAIANGMKLLLGVIAQSDTQTVVEAKLRLKRVNDDESSPATLDLRTVAEGGAGPDSDLINLENLPAYPSGARHTITVEVPGRYYFAWALKNQFGWSPTWTDGSAFAAGPSSVPKAHSINTKNVKDTGPPQNWSITTVPGEQMNTVRVKVKRPEINGKWLLWIAVQVKDTSVGVWRTVDEDAGAADTLYDGTTVSHSVNDGGTRLRRDSGAGFGTAQVGDLLLVDVRGGGQFHRNYCQWGTVNAFEGDNPATATYIELHGGYRPQQHENLRIKIVKPPHIWNTEGYLGDLPGHGIWWKFIANDLSDEFVSDPIDIGGNYNSIDARAWFENEYCRSDASGTVGAATVSLNQVKVKAVRDDALPGPVENFSVTGSLGWFTAKWDDPLTNYATIDDVGIQWATDAGFTAIVGTAKNWGDVNTLKGEDANKTYFWRIAAHNLSDAPSHATTISHLGPTGWGPWRVFGSPSPVSSGAGAAGPTDSVIPGPVLSLDVQGRNGEFIANWAKPSSGYNTIDDHGIKYSTNASFTGANISKGWGPGTHQQSTAPNQTYYFAIAAHNQSGALSDSSTSTELGPTGWGPWTIFSGNPVSSGPVPIDQGQVAQDIIYNGGFELMASDGKPDGWILAEAGAGGYGTWAVSTDDPIEGRYDMSMLNNGRWGVASKAFAVREGEQLVFSMWARRIANPNAGMYFRVFWNANDPNFTPATDYVDIVGGADPGGGWTQYKKRLTVPAGKGFCRVGLYQYGTDIDSDCYYLYDDVQVLRTVDGGGGEILPGSVPPSILTPENRIDFIEVFEENALTSGVWTISGSASMTTGGISGNGLLRTDGQVVMQGPAIPFDPRKLYRMNIRIYCESIGSGVGHGVMYIGFSCLDANKGGIGEIRCVHNGFVWFGARGAGQWFEDQGWIKGVGGTAWTGPSPSAGAPLPLLNNTRYFAPVLYISYGSPAGASNIFYLDDIRIESVSQSAEVPTAAYVDLSITTTKISDDAISTPKLQANSVQANKIAAGSITSDKISVTNLSAINTNVGTLTGGLIQGLEIRTAGGNQRVAMDSSGFHSYDAAGSEYFLIAPQAIGTRMYGYEFRMHPNITAGNSMIIGGVSQGTHLLLHSADAPALLGGRTAVYLVHGDSASGYIQFLTQNAQRLILTASGYYCGDNIFFHLQNAGDPGTPGQGITLLGVSGYLGMRTATNPYVGSVVTPNNSIQMWLNGQWISIPVAV